MITSLFLVILRINSNIRVTETSINRLSAFLKVGLSSPVHHSRTSQWRQHTRMDPWVLFISQVCTNAFFGKVTESKKEKLEMRILWVRTLRWTKMPLMSENGTSRIEFISKFYQKALRNKQANKPWQSKRRKLIHPHPWNLSHCPAGWACLLMRCSILQ